MESTKQAEPQKPKGAPAADVKKKDLKGPPVDKMIRGAVREK